jgi:hypothetical protein
VPTVDLDQAEALRALGRLPREELPEVATAALAAGVDSPSLQVLAGVTTAELDRAWDLFDQALRELGRRPVASGTPGQRQAVLWAKATAAGAVPALEGANALWSVWEDASDEELKAVLVEFLLDQERWERALPEHRPAVERQIVQRARALVHRWNA